jgi:putative SOS response-associated peptidase YedK
MCSRYELNADRNELAGRFRLNRTPEEMPGPELRPTDRALAVLAERRPEILHWGLPGRDGKPILNARAETLAEKPTFRLLLGQRCLVPATAYFEWRKKGRMRFRTRISLGGRPFAFAGIETGARFAIVTCAPSAAVAHIHDRMPVILAESAEAAWLDPAAPFAEIKDLLVPYADDAALTIKEESPSEAVQPDLFDG